MKLTVSVTSQTMIRTLIAAGWTRVAVKDDLHTFEWSVTAKGWPTNPAQVAY